MASKAKKGAKFGRNARNNSSKLQKTRTEKNRRIRLEKAKKEGALALSLRSVTLSAKEKACLCKDAEGRPACLPEACPYANGYYERLKDALADLLDSAVPYDRTALTETARRHRVCPFELGLDLSEWCDVVIGDYNYLFDPTVHLRRFFDAAGGAFVPVGGTLSRIERIDNTDTLHLLDGVEVVAMCDIDNPMHGLRGAAYVFSPQKGAYEQTVRLLDSELVALDEALVRELGARVAQLPGAGAAGAMGAGAVAFFGARLNPGIETVLDTVRFEERVAGADFVITGEGRLDSQSLRGKVVIGVSRRAKRLNIPVLAVVGDVGDGIDEAYREGVTAIFSTNRLAIPFSEAKHRSKKDYRLTIENLLRALSALETKA